MLLGVLHHPEPHVFPGDDSVLEFGGSIVGIHKVDTPTPRRIARVKYWGWHWKMTDRRQYYNSQGEVLYGAGAMVVPLVLEILIYNDTIV